VLTGKFSKATKVTDPDDDRISVNFAEGRVAQVLDKLDELREVLTRDGRTMPQAALGWIWAQHSRAIPSPGFKTVQQVE
jgi:aryl-alcohol dehydrogenase-like predicted oxidoreductase